MSLKGLLNYKTVLLLLFVVVVNLVVGVLVWSLDFFVHGDLYAYGLVYSLGWADPYWSYTAVLWAFLGGTTAFAGVAIIPHYLGSRKISGFSTCMGFILPVFALVYQGLGIFYFDQKNLIVLNMLNGYGVQYDVEWVGTFGLISLTAFVLMVVAFVALFIPVIRALRHNSIMRD